MELPNSLIREFASLLNQKQDTDKNKIAYGQIVESDGEKFVKLDGSEELTPAQALTNIRAGERVMVLIQKHTATIVGNASSPAATDTDLQELGESLSNIEITATSQVFTMEDGASEYSPETITLIPKLRVIDGLVNLKWYWSGSDPISWTEITSTAPSSTAPYINQGLKSLVIPRNTSYFESNANTLIFKIAYILNNEELYSDMMSIFRIKEATDGEASYSVMLTNEAVSITTTNDYLPVTAGSYNCDVKVFKGTQLLTPVLENPEEGEFSITAETEEGGLTIDTETVAGRVSFSTDTNSVLSSYSEIEVTITIGGLNGTLTKIISLSASPEGGKGEDATVLRIDSSHGIVFKNNLIGTSLSVTVVTGGRSITDLQTLRSVYGNDAYIQWYFRRTIDDDWQEMLSSDSHITDDGFTLTLTPSDVDEQIIFQADLITSGSSPTPGPVEYESAEEHAW